MAFFQMKKMILAWTLRKPVTTNYPFEPRKIIPGSRGRLDIQISACIFCGICAKRCPTDALVVDKPNKKWHIDRLRCISCGACTEACPKKCLQLTGDHGIPAVTKDMETF
jgi:formate hydrogenlyase subunit 6/NADH:ubiquinone oxidoreductase subunit I